ncbi:MAG: thiamine-binding protein [Flavobacteriales bacterium]|nr:thiamine-binding protein [Flavobacteriales bacterium]MCW8913978.1 thiamine-binding protein [Flavobacteriales bacterium]MCW8938864.1 thiamine-binding protein [Flavobacteriales bacterium]MCW8941529.1 thiamine-binding protein [Flavobacteriales bacterium]MCW8967437.1 thiamine-binding protein [Flavobacteriales bacterium]
MKTTIEISNYPLNANYIPPIQDFIDRISVHTNIKVKVNATSTHIVGEIDEVMPIIQQEIKTSFEKYGKMIFVMKVLNGALDI